MKNQCKQSKKALELGVQIRCTEYASLQMLALDLRISFPLMEIGPWRNGAMITARLLTQRPHIRFIEICVLDTSPRKSGNFGMHFAG